MRLAQGLEVLPRDSCVVLINLQNVVGDRPLLVATTASVHFCVSLVDSSPFPVHLDLLTRYLLVNGSH